jgi:hypothetical protein
LEAAARLEIATSIPGWAGNSVKSGDTSHPDILHECLYAPEDFVYQDQFPNAEFLVGFVRHTLDEME